MAATEAPEVLNLQLEAVIGFNGHVFSGLRVHPDQEHIIYPLGCTLIIKNLLDKKQSFLHGHTNNVSCVSVSRSGTYLASGQVTFMGFKADVIIWDYAKRDIHARLVLHKAKVEALAFSPNEKYLVTLGGQDDGSIVVWNVQTKEAICGSPASAHSAGHCLSINYCNLSDDVFISAGHGTLRVWELDLPNRKIRPTECQTGQLKRIIKCIEIVEDDSFFYCGTTSGDVLRVNLKSRLLNSFGPQKHRFSKGVNAMKMLKTGDLLVGSGDGTFSLCSSTNFKTLKSVTLEGGVTSVALRGEGQQVFVGTEASQIYRFGYTDFTPELITSSHCSAVWDAAFPEGTSELFASCSQDDIRVWNTESSKELLRIRVPNMTCNAIGFMRDGRSIYSAWNDGKIRLFTPESGRLMLMIPDAHSMGVTALRSTSDCKRLVSGGGEGQVRVWEILQDTHKLIASMKEHKASVNAVKIKSNDKECVTASSDGTCIIWDLVRFVRNQMVLANTLFKSVCYHPEEYQIITSGTDRKIGYWEVYDGAAIRELEGSQSGAINGMDISSEGGLFITGGDEKLVKVWRYADGDVTHVGVGHSGSISSVCLCPNNRFIITTSTDGAVLRWRFPRCT
ncbi:cilia- and flagella-associated protein 52 [Tachysurus vachellii]|uniref:cilia- and flagella-associated protein 52 n=1 Tax=Tachysurus vachellii TaxID=175792 RepID=UPI00296B30CD|nr:cilia- and flagella-associated protein 52 [Tachysurus vachellii]